MRTDYRPKGPHVSRGVALNLLASALTILAAIALLGSATLVDSAPLAAPQEAKTTAVVRAFYDAVNEVLRNGDTAPLAKIAPDLTVQGVPPGVSPDRNGLERYLLAIHVASPGVQLAIDDLTVADTRAIARVTPMTGSAMRFLGMPLAAQPPWWGSFDAIQTAEGRVTELWSGLEGTLLLEPLRQVHLEPSSEPRQISMERLHGAAGKAWRLGTAWQPQILYVTAGSLTISADPALDPSLASPAAAPAADTTPGVQQMSPGTTVTVLAGEALLLPPAIRYTVLPSAAPADVEALLVAFHSHGFVGQPDLSPDHPAYAAMAMDAVQVERRLLTVARTELRQENLSVSFGRLTLPPGASLALARAQGPLLLRVEAGTLGIDALKGKESNPKDSETIALRLASGKATIVPQGALTTLYAAGDEPVTAFAITILPSHTVPGAPS